MRMVKVIAKACGPEKDYDFEDHAGELRYLGLHGDIIDKNHNGVVSIENAARVVDRALTWRGNWKILISNVD